MLVLDPNYVQARNVYVQLALSFRFGREEDESMGYNFVKTMYLATTQLFPPVKDITTSEIQVCLSLLPSLYLSIKQS